jgi:hypothetical protein
MKNSTTSRSSRVRASALAALTFAFALAALPKATAEAQTWTGPELAPRLELSPDQAANRDLQLALSPAMQRAVRTVRAGGVITGLGLATALAGGALWVSLLPECDSSCGNWRARVTGSASLLIAGGGLLTAGLLTWGIGVKRRNHLRRADALALRVGAGSVGLDLQF